MAGEAHVRLADAVEREPGQEAGGVNAQAQEAIPLDT